MEGYDKLCDQIKTKAIPAVKAKSQSFVKDAGIIASGIKDGLAGKTPKALALVNENTAVKSSKGSYKRHDKGTYERASRSKNHV